MRLMIQIKSKGESWDSETHETQKGYCGIMSRDSCDSVRLMETLETQGDSWGFGRLMRLIRNFGNSWDSDYCGLMRFINSLGLMRLRETNADSWDSGRLLGILETHETHREYWGLMRPSDYWGLLRLIETVGDSWDPVTTGDSWDSWRPLGSHESQRNYCTVVSLNLTPPHESLVFLWVPWVPSSLSESHESPLVSLSLMSPQ